MDELEKKEVTDAEVSDKEALEKELEEIRDMFQDALDNAQQEAEAAELIQELEEATEEAAEDEDNLAEIPFCECCGENKVNTAYGEDYPYCEECRELMKHYPLRKRGVLAILAMIIVFAVTVFYGYDSMESAIGVLEAKIYADEGRRISAIYSLYDYVSKETDSKKVKELLVDSFCNAGYLTDAYEYINNTFTKEELEKPSNKKYKQIVESINVFIATQEATEGLVYDAFRGEEFDYDELAAKLDEVANSYIDEESGLKYESVLTDYYKAELMQVKKMDLEAQLEILQGVEKADETGIYSWIYLSSLCEVAGKLGDKELAESYFEKMKKLNSEDMMAYKAYASYFRYLDTPDADGMIKLCEEAEKYAYQDESSYLTVLATAYLIKGEGALAYSTMQEYMAANRYTVTDCNLYALCALYCGNSGTYETMKSTLESVGYQIGAVVEKYKDGEITIAEAIADMGGDLG